MNYNHNHLSLCLFGILACFVCEIDVHEVILNGQTAEHEDIRYQVTLLIDGHSPSCGGGILNEESVLTAAHCVIDFHNGRLISKNISVIVGTYDLSIQSPIAHVQRVFLPEDYVSQFTNSTGDIAVLRLRTPLELKCHDLKILQLSKTKSNTYVGTVARIAGFGWDKMDENHPLIGIYSDHRLRFADADVVSDSQCQLDHPYQNITEKQLCAKVRQYHERFRHSHPRGACIADEGSPLVSTNMPYRHIVIGVLSASELGCSEVTSSSIYTRVTHYRQLILKALNNSVTKHIKVLDV